MASFDDQTFDGVRYESIIRLAAWIGLPVAFGLSFAVAFPATGDPGQAAAIAALPGFFSAPFFGIIFAFGILRLRVLVAGRRETSRLGGVVPVAVFEPPLAAEVPAAAS